MVERDFVDIEFRGFQYYLLPKASPNKIGGQMISNFLYFKICYCYNIFLIAVKFNNSELTLPKL